MKEHGILMKPEMIRAYRAGQKTQTRRIGNRYKNWKVGDVLWFRETWRTSKAFDHLKPSELRDGTPIQYETALTMRYHGRYRQAMFMPRWACRHTAKITSIREERLNDISEADALEEGIERSDWKYSCEPYRNYHHPKMAPGHNKSFPPASFATLWDSINGKKPGRSWHDNPLVWRIQFERYEPCGDESK